MSESDGDGSPERWIIVRNWERFQHYNPELRDPPWIKTYTALLSDDNYRSLTGNRRAILHGLWLEYARSKSWIRLEVRDIGSRLGLGVKMADLESLNRAGFLEFTLARPDQRTLPLARAGSEVEVEKNQPQTEARTPLIDREARPDENGDLSEIGWSVPDYMAAIEASRQREET